MSEGLPDGWIRIPLRHVGTWYGGGTPSKSNDSYWTDGDIPWLSPKDMGADTITGTEDHITAAAVESSATKLVPANSVAVVVRSGILERTLPVGLVPFETTLNQDMKAVVARAGIEPAWIAWALRAFAHAVLSDCRKRGTTVASLDSQRLLDLEIPIAPLPEQRRIIAALDEQLSRLEAAQENLSNGHDRFLAADASLLDAAVRGKLSAVSDESSSDLLASIARTRSSLTKKSAATPASLPAYSLPSGWSIASLDMLCWGSGYGTSVKCSYEGTGVAVLRIPNIQGGQIDINDLKYTLDQDVDLSQLLVRKADILFVRTNGSRELIGRAAVAAKDVDAAFASYLIRFRLIPNGIDPRWVQIVVSSPVWRRHLMAHAASSAGQHNLNLKVLSALPIPVPPETAQRAIIDTLERRRAQLSHVRRAAEILPTKAQALRNSLLKAAFSGQLVPQDPSDEPASDLLDRIRLEQPVAWAHKQVGRTRTNFDRPAPAKTNPVPIGIQEELPL